MDATELAESYTALDRYASNPLPTVFGYTSSALVGEELVGVVSEAQPDVVIVDAMFSAALAVSPQFGRPTAVMLHTFLNRCLAMWRGNFQMKSEARERAGFAPLPSLDALWGERDLMHVNALPELDGAPRSRGPTYATEHRCSGAWPGYRRSLRHGTRTTTERWSC